MLRPARQILSRDLNSPTDAAYRILWKHNGADATLTMTVFKITGDARDVERYTPMHNLKSAGVTNASGTKADTPQYHNI